MRRFRVERLQGQETVETNLVEIDEIPENAGILSAHWNDEDISMDVCPVDENTYSVLHEGNSYVIDIQLPQKPNQPTQVRVGALSFALRLLESTHGTDAAADGGGAKEERITAPIPGRVVRVLVEKDQIVGAHTAVAIVEAMKMENVLATRTGGRVVEVLIQAGQTVEAGQTLMELTSVAPEEDQTTPRLPPQTPKP